MVMLFMESFVAPLLPEVSGLVGKLILMFQLIHPTKFVHIQNFDVPAVYLNKSFFLKTR